MNASLHSPLSATMSLPATGTLATEMFGISGHMGIFRELEQARGQFANLCGQGAFVFKLGGSVTGQDLGNVHDPKLREIWEQLAHNLIFLQQATNSTCPIVVVHGGGKAIDAELERQGITPQKRNGRRVTDEQTMAVVEQVLSKTINPALVSVINRIAGEEIAVGIAGSSVIQAKQAAFDGDALGGHVGQVTRVDAEKILQFQGKIVVVSPTGRTSASSNHQSTLLNINGDDAASAVAQAVHKALRVQSFVAATDVAGVLSADRTLLPVISGQSAATLKEQGVIQGGMIPKIDSALELCASGINRVRFVDGREPTTVAMGVLPECTYGTLISTAL